MPRREVQNVVQAAAMPAHISVQDFVEGMLCANPVALPFSLNPKQINSNDTQLGESKLE